MDYDGFVAASFTPVDDDVYREIILDHYRNPRHKGMLEPFDRGVEANNPACGDEIDLRLRLDGRDIRAVAFTGQGCSISQASASMLCESVTGMDTNVATQLASRFRAMLQGADVEDLGDLDALRGVRAYPVRVKCAALAWNALLQALHSRDADAAEESLTT